MPILLKSAQGPIAAQLVNCSLLERAREEKPRRAKGQQSKAELSLAPRPKAWPLPRSWRRILAEMRRQGGEENEQTPFLSK